MAALRVYDPTIVTGPRPIFVDINRQPLSVPELADRLKANADTLLTDRRHAIDPNNIHDRALHDANQEIKHITDILLESHDEMLVSRDLLALTQNTVDRVQRALRQAEINMRTIIRERDASRRFMRHWRWLYDTEHEQAKNLARQVETLTRERNIAIIQANNTDYRNGLLNNQLAALQAQLTHANNRVLFGIRALARLRNRLNQQLNALRIQVQWFRHNRQLNPAPNMQNHPQTWLILH